MLNPSTVADVALVRRDGLPEPDSDMPLVVHLASVLGRVLVMHRLSELNDLSVEKTVAQSFVWRLAVGLDLEVLNQPRNVAHKPWNELVVHVKLNRVHFRRSGPQCATQLCGLLVCSLDAASTRTGANKCVEKHCVMLPAVTHQLCHLLVGLLLIREETDARPAREAQRLSDDSNLRDHCTEHSTLTKRRAH